MLTGSRQSGKTTLFQMLFSKGHNFVSLEDSDIRIRAKEDPKGFLNQYRHPVIIDEIQYLPEVLSFIKTEIDNDRKPGNWLLAGSPIDTAAIISGTEDNFTVKGDVINYGLKNVSGF